MRRLTLCLSAVVATTATAVCAEVRSPAETATWKAGLTDREMAIGRWFSSLTFKQDRAAKPWPEWHDDGHQLGTTSLRYQLAFAGYGCAAMDAKTPAYRELAEKQLRDLCERMIDLRVWSYVTHYWDYGNGPPDPCLHENVMYTGHLTQLMCLYELLTGDKRYSESGWDFVWRDGRKVHYNLRQAVERLHVQSEKSASGGICCEPGLVFATCNSHSAASFLLFDLLHGTRYADVNKKWFSWMSKHFRTTLPASREFFQLVYDERQGRFAPVGDVGADCWTLGWSYPWFPSTNLTHEGWRHVLDKVEWHQPTPDRLYAQGNLLVGCCGGGSTALSNAFVPLLAVQIEGQRSPTARKVLRWLEANYGQEVDLDGDGYRECYFYQTDSALRIATTGNIAAAMATDGDSLRQLFRTPRRPILDAPTVAHVDYPNVYVRTAEYVAPVLRFTVLKGTPGFQGKTDIVCTRMPKKVTAFRNGLPFQDFSQTGSKVVIRTDVDHEYVFEVTMSP
ncbi:MAG: hypothetical protein ACLQNE_00935 [Thermoguttaceae bacterium]